MPRVRPKYELCVGFEEEEGGSDGEGGGEGCDHEGVEEEEFDIRQVWQQLQQEEADRRKVDEADQKQAGAIQENNKKAKQRSSFLAWKQQIQVIYIMFKVTNLCVKMSSLIFLWTVEL